MPAPSAFTSRGRLDGDEAMLRIVLIVAAVLLALKVAVTAVAYLMGGRDPVARLAAARWRGFCISRARHGNLPHVPVAKT